MLLFQCIFEMTFSTIRKVLVVMTFYIILDGLADLVMPFQQSITRPSRSIALRSVVEINTMLS